MTTQPLSGESRWKVRWDAFVAFTSEREGGECLGVVRILVGLVAAYAMAEMIFTGMLDVVWMNHLTNGGGGAFTLENGPWLIRLLGGPTHNVILSLAITAMIGSLVLALGVGGRWPTLVTLHAFTAVTRLNNQAGGGYDPLLTNAMWLLFLGNASTGISVDAWIRTRRSGAQKAQVPTVLAIIRRLLVFQILLVYGMTGLQKLSPVWTPAGGYSALYWVFQEPTWRRYDMRWTAPFYLLTQIGTAITWHWETSAFGMFVYYWLRVTRERGGRLRRWAQRFDLRIPYLIVGVCLHMGILLLLDVGHFSFASLAYYPAFFRSEELVLAWERVRSRMSRGSPA